jgi:hypothetical protein
VKIRKKKFNPERVCFTPACSAATLYTQVLFHAAGAAQQSSQAKIRYYTISPRTLREIIDKTLK